MVLTQRAASGQCAETERFGTISPKQDIFIEALSSRLRDVCGRESRKKIQK